MDLAEDTAALHLRLLEAHLKIIRLIEMIEQKSDFDREPLCSEFIRRRLDVISSHPENSNKDLMLWLGC